LLGLPLHEFDHHQVVFTLVGHCIDHCLQLLQLMLQEHIFVCELLLDKVFGLFAVGKLSLQLFDLLPVRLLLGLELRC
jgi:hypothetical protein